jgi:hypothetical protein
MVVIKVVVDSTVIVVVISMLIFSFLKELVINKRGLCFR